MREEELRAYRNKAIEKDRRAIENRLNHAFNQGYEMGRQMAKDLPVELQCVLCKIRSEIEQEYNRLSATRSDETLELGECLGLKMSLKIIDKYITGGCDKERVYTNGMNT